MDKHMLAREIERSESISLPVKIIAVSQQSSVKSGLQHGRSESEAGNAIKKVEVRGKAVIIVPCN